MASEKGCPGAPPAQGRPERVVSRAARGSRGKKLGFNGPPRGGRVYTPIDWEAKMEIPVISFSIEIRAFGSLIDSCRLAGSYDRSTLCGERGGTAALSSLHSQ